MIQLIAWEAQCKQNKLARNLVKFNHSWQVIDKYHSEVKSGDDFDVLRPASLAGEELLEWYGTSIQFNACCHLV